MDAKLFRLTRLEEVAALSKAHIDADCETWDEKTLEAASVVLDAAYDAKVERLTVHKHNPGA